MSENGKYFNSASENEQWLKAVIVDAVPYPERITEEELESIYHGSYKLSKTEFLSNFIRAKMSGSTWDIQPVEERDEGIICEMYNKDSGSLVYFCVKGSFITSYNQVIPIEYIEKVEFLMRAVDDSYPTLINNIDDLTCLFTYQEFVEGAQLVGHKVIALDDNGDPIGEDSYIESASEIDDFDIKPSISISSRLSNLQLVLLDD